MQQCEVIFGNIPTNRVAVASPDLDLLLFCHAFEVVLDHEKTCFFVELADLECKLAANVEGHAHLEHEVASDFEEGPALGAEVDEVKGETRGRGRSRTVADFGVACAYPREVHEGNSVFFTAAEGSAKYADGLELG